MNKKYKYRAFISYAHKDKAFALWLHRSIENYTIPKSLRIKYKHLPKDLKRTLFRDEEELASASDLSATLKLVLEDSEKLIVVCSEYAVKSKWVEEEISYFKELHNEEKILTIIKSGEPEDVFPKALRDEPLAVDARIHRKVALFKIIASLLEVDFADLWKREKRERDKRFFIRVLFVMIFSLLGLYTYFQSVAISSNSELKKINKDILILENELKDSDKNKNETYLIREQLKDLEESKKLKEETLKWFGMLKTSLTKEARKIYDREGAEKALLILESENSVEEDKFYAKKNMLRAKLYLEISEFEDADKFYNKAIAIDSVYVTVYDYALFLMKQNQLHKAKELLEALIIDDLEKVERANVLNRLGIVYRKLKQPKDAKRVYRKALLLRKELSEQNPKIHKSDLAWTYNNLGILYKTNKEFELSEKAHLKALSLRQSLFEDDAQKYTYHLSCSLHNLGELYSTAHREQKAETYLLSVLEMRTALYRKNPKEFRHPLAWTKHELASLYASLNRMEEAEVFYKEALDLRRILIKSNLNAYKFVFNDTVQGLAKLYERRGLEEEATKLYLEMKPLEIGECDAT